MGKVKKENKKLKDYMNSNERNEVAIIGKLIDELDVFIKTWGERENLSPEEHKGFKTALTWANKAWDLVTARMNDKSIIGYVKRQNSYSVHVYDRAALEQAEKKIRNTTMELYKREEHFYNLCGLVMDHHCKDCTGKDSECDIAKLFIENNVQEPIEEPHYSWKHCKYAYCYSDVVKKAREIKGDK